MGRCLRPDGKLTLMHNGSEAGNSRGGDPGTRRSLNIAVSRTVFSRASLVLIAALGLLAQGFLFSVASAQDTGRTSRRSLPSVEVGDSLASSRDSLMSEIRIYSEMISSLRDSLTEDGTGLRLSPEQREKLEGNISDISEVIERISSELSRMEFEIKDNRISLVNEAGEGIVINVPEDLDEQVSEGIEAITKIILSEMPDSVGFDHARKWDWNRFRPEPPPPARRVINGNMVKVWDDVRISAKEDVRGNVVVIFGDAEIAGRVDGNVVAVFGNTSLEESTEVTGSVVTIGGYLDQETGAVVDDVFVLDPMRLDQGSGLFDFFSHDRLTFLVSQGVFLLTVMLALLAVLLTPERRFQVITGKLQGSFAGSLVWGVLTALGGHLVVAILMAILVLTVIGVPLALLVGLALLIVVVVSVAVCGAVVGNAICTAFGGKCPARGAAVVLGMSILHIPSFLGALLGIVGGPQVLVSLLVTLGLIIKSFAYFLGLGAVVLSRAGTRTETDPVS